MTAHRSPEARAQAYVRDHLDADGIYAEAEAALAVLSDAHDRIADTGARKRALVEEMDTIELDLTTRERADKAELSQAAFERYIKPVLHNDPELRALRARVDEVSAEHERANLDARLAERTITVKSSRMQELAGVLAFYASVKVGTANETVHPH
jgi:hypothetical protein